MKVSQLMQIQMLIKEAESRFKIQSPTAYISIGIKSKNNLNTPIKMLKKIIYAIQDSKASIRRQQPYTRSVHKGLSTTNQLWCST